MNIFCRYLIRNIFLGFAAAAAVLIPLFSTFNLINELDDVSPAGYHWTQALMVMLMTIPRDLIDLGPFIALLGGIIGMGQLSKNLELTAIRSVGFSIFRIGLVALLAGALITVTLSVLDEWVASPLQQRALQLKTNAMAQDEDNDNASNILWARKGNEFVTVKRLDEDNQPVGVEIFNYNPDLSLDNYIYAQRATILKNGKWLLSGVNQKNWRNREKIVTSPDTLEWQSIFTDMTLQELAMPSDSFSIRQLNHYIRYLDNTGQPSIQFRLALWQKLGKPILTLAMILLAVPFTFVAPRSPGMGSRLFIGVVVGLLTYISYQIIVNLGLLFSLNALVATVLPSLLLLFVALLLVYRFNR
ncbi:LPS export ABC transporter permease LptG [Citrobacter sp. BNK-39]|uniref:LPS export ABC transporter permease LptG n=1 Tax=Citrobacter TaxID=544 RepID=UPI0012E56603|nr:LPS export ABC transporter permease LptG [Citrobacter koseri]ECZ5655329.1 LPS export ABC transporter permease LptG [Salmonella enterica subsp. enterica serovar Agona]HAT2303917.1 LPS export ABC transporter permease LptG [Citrobacter freundii]HEE0475199.1 LPS export ABC transporter permease LptG [Klebsiella pneumoniae]MDT7497173.1 LPS export ABC transporter permease LptG [Citrobacter koseri]HEM7946122.1 LPS export ABC transporter permease LptG [Citrobacter freundii]